MGLAVSSAHARTETDALGRLSSQELIQIYRLMYLSRRIDDREILLKRQQKIFFQISASLGGSSSIAPSDGGCDASRSIASTIRMARFWFAR